MSGENKTILMLAKCFPPRHASGCFRVLRFTNLLPDFGWNCEVVTLEEGCHPSQNPQLLSQIRADTNITRFKCGELSAHCRRWLGRRNGLPGKTLSPAINLFRKGIEFVSTPDPEVWTGGRIFKAACEVIESKKPNVIWITGPSFSWFLLTEKLKKRFSLPVVLDFRDPWTLNPLAYRGLRRWRLHIDRILERKVFKAADHIVLNTQSALDGYKLRYPCLDHSKWSVITNGFDSESLMNIQPEIFDGTVLVHGGMTGGRRTGKYLLKAIERLYHKGVISGSNFHYIAYGTPEPGEAEVLKELPESLVRFRGRCSYEQVASSVRGGSVAVLLVAQGHELSVPAKLYEYLGLGKPILLAGPEDSEAAKIIRRCKAGVVSAMNDVDCLESILTDIVQGRFNVEPDVSLIQSYTSRFLTEKLSNVLNALTSEQH